MVGYSFYIAVIKESCFRFEALGKGFFQEMAPKMTVRLKKSEEGRVLSGAARQGHDEFCSCSRGAGGGDASPVSPDKGFGEAEPESVAGL